MNDTKVINILKGLVIDAVDKAGSGHPGGPMSSMDFTYTLFTEYLRFDPADSEWLGRDRFILSAGHSSMLLYSMLLCQGYLKMEDIKQFRQLHSRTPGHPENFLTPGVECTTGPLGQGAAMSVGFAIASRHFQARLDDELFKQRIWVVLGDGCIQEDVTLGAASLAGHLKLNHLVWFFDSNEIQISGEVSRAQSDDVAKVFEGFGWEVVTIDGHDLGQIRSALDRGANLGARTKPLLIVGQTRIAKGAHSLEGSAKTHGSPLPKDERAQTKKKLGLPEADFYLPEEAVAHFRRNFETRKQEVKAWNERLTERLADKDFAKLYRHCFEEFDGSTLTSVSWKDGDKVATRNAFGDVLERWARDLPNLIGGSADLEPSNMTEAFAHLVGDFSHENPRGRNIVFGVREFPMAAICNGIALFGGLIPFGATFLSFADYSRPAIRLGALQKVRVIHEFTHDSFYLGEDGPTHQPIEHVMSLRLIPDLYVMRPADARETQVLMTHSLHLETPSAICLTRQKLPILPVSEQQVQLAKKGAYEVTRESSPEYVIIATGSEVSLALDVAKKMAPAKVRVISMPCWELFEEQDSNYKDSLLPKNGPKMISIEAGATLGWQKYTGMGGLNIGIDHFGHSAPASDLEKLYGFYADAVIKRIQTHHFGV
jgi:transketolase